MEISALVSKIRTCISLLSNPKKLILPMSQNGMLKWIPDKLFLKLVFWAELGRKLNLKTPKWFSEKLQWLKLYDRQEIYTTMVDKYLVKDVVASSIGREYIIPTIGVWDRAEDIDFEKLPDRFVLKCNHDSGGVVICQNKLEFNQIEAVQKLNMHLRRDSYYSSREWPYKGVKRKIIAEKLLFDPENDDLIDYKFYCFGGEPRYCQVIKDRRVRETIDFYDTNWILQPFTGLGLGLGFPHGSYTEKPKNYETMLLIARKLSAGTKFVRIDLYNINGHVYFGEFTLYPKSGLGIFLPDEWNKKIGDMLHLEN